MPVDQRPTNRPIPPASPRAEPAKRRSAAVPWTVAAVAAVVTVVALVVPQLGGESRGSGSASSSAGAGSSKGPDTRAVFGGRTTPGDPTSLGRRDAPVVMLAYSDFQCPFCGKFARTTEQTLVKKYVDAGVLRIEWRDFPYLGKESKTAALAARAAAAQGRFWAFHDALYAHQSPPNSGRLTPDYLRGLARDIGLDMSEFNREMKGPLAAKLVQHDFNEGLSSGLTGTPSFLINGEPVIGAQPVSEFESVIEAARRQADH